MKEYIVYIKDAGAIKVKCEMPIFQQGIVCFGSLIINIDNFEYAREL